MLCRLVMMISSMLMMSSLYASDLGIIFGQNTRMIMTSDEKTIGLNVGNYNSKHYLVHAKVVESDQNYTTSSNFIITPELSEINPDSKKTFSIRRLEGNYPEDRESLVYIVGRFIPKVTSNNSNAKVELSLTFKMKMFLRPESLDIGDAVEKSVNEVKYEYINEKLKITNLSPYHLTYYKLIVDRIEVSIPDGLKMLKPFESIYIECKAKPHKITWSFIGDSGFETAQVTRNFTN